MAIHECLPSPLLSSNCSRLAIRCSSSSHNVSNRILSDSFSLNLSRAWMPIRMGLFGCLFCMLSGMPIMYYVTLCPSLSNFHWRSFRGCFEASSLLILPIRLPVGSKAYCACGLLHRILWDSLLLDLGSVVPSRSWFWSDNRIVKRNNVQKQKKTKHRKHV